MKKQITELRQASRDTVRELGFFQTECLKTGVTHPQSHALIELEKRGEMTIRELSTALQIDHSTASRLVTGLTRARLVRAAKGQDDKREKRLVLTPKGALKTVAVHTAAEARVEGALSLLDATTKRAVLKGFTEYAAALKRSRIQNEFNIRRIEKRDNKQIASVVRKVGPEFGHQGPGTVVASPELDKMFQIFQGPRSVYYVLEREGRVVGGAGIRALEDGDKNTCELQRMYLLPEARGFGMGERLLQLCLKEAKRMRYKRCYLETRASMTQAQNMYRKHGFRRLKRPLGNTGYFACDGFYARKL